MARGLEAPGGHEVFTLTSAAAFANPATTTPGGRGDGIPDYVYYPATGDLVFRTDGNTGAVQEVHVRSASSQLRPQNLVDPIVGINGVDWLRPNDIDLFRIGNSPTDPGQRNRFPDGYDIGPILPAGLGVDALLQDLTLTYTIDGSRQPNAPSDQTVGGTASAGLSIADVTTPEPTAGLALTGIAAAGLLGRTRRRKIGSCGLAS